MVLFQYMNSLWKWTSVDPHQLASLEVDLHCIKFLKKNPCNKGCFEDGICLQI